jgi:hypothetical protein
MPFHEPAELLHADGVGIHDEEPHRPAVRLGGPSAQCAEHVARANRVVADLAQG